MSAQTPPPDGFGAEVRAISDTDEVIPFSTENHVLICTCSHCKGAPRGGFTGFAPLCAACGCFNGERRMYAEFDDEFACECDCHWPD